VFSSVFRCFYSGVLSFFVLWKSTAKHSQNTRKTLAKHHKTPAKHHKTPQNQNAFAKDLLTKQPKFANKKRPSPGMGMVCILP